MKKLLFIASIILATATVGHANTIDKFNITAEMQTEIGGQTGIPTPPPPPPPFQ